MTVQPTFESEDSIPDISLRELYTKDEATGQMVLNPTAIKGFKTEAEFNKVYGALKSERTLKSTFENDLKTVLNGKTKDEILQILDGFEAQSQAQQTQEPQKKDQSEIDKLVQAKTLRYEREKNELLAKYKQLEDQVNAFNQEKKDRSIAEVIRQSATRLNVLPEALDVMLRYSSEFDIDELGDVRTRDGKFTPEEYIANMQEKFPFMFKSPQGTGATGSSRGGSGSTGGVRRITKAQAQDFRFYNDLVKKGYNVVVEG